MNLFTLPEKTPEPNPALADLLAERRTLETELATATSQMQQAFAGFIQAPFAVGAITTTNQAMAGYRIALANINANASVLIAAGYSGFLPILPAASTTAPIVTCEDPLSEKPLTLYRVSATRRVSTIVPAMGGEPNAVRTFARQMDTLFSRLNPLDDAITCEPVRLGQTDTAPYEADNAGLGTDTTIGDLIARFRANQPQNERDNTL